MTAPVITQSLIENNIDVVWDLFHEHLESIRGIHGVTILWCTCTKVFLKYQLLDPSQEYLYVDKEMIDWFPIILESCGQPRDEVWANTIGLRIRTPMFKKDNKTIFPYLL